MPHLTEHTGQSWVSCLMRPFMLSLIVLLIVVLPFPAMAFPIYQSATLGSTEPGYPYVISYEQVLGVRFYVDKRVTIGSIGGYFSEYQPGLESDIVGAIVRLHGAHDVPNSFDLTTRDVLGTTLVHVSDTAGDFAGNLDLTLRRGWYALVFVPGGPGQAFEAQMPTVSTDIGDPSYFFGRTDSSKRKGFEYLDADLSGIRMFVDTNPVAPVPEPATLLLLGSGLVGLGSVAWRRTRQK